MERRLREEVITLTAMAWLKDYGWYVVAYDYPQSGTGVAIQSKNRPGSHKNLNSIIPDIVVLKDSKVIFFENKTNYFEEDVQLLRALRDTDEYSESVGRLLRCPIEDCAFFYGVALADTPSNRRKLSERAADLDVHLVVNAERKVSVLASNHALGL